MVFSAELRNTPLKILEGQKSIREGRSLRVFSISTSLCILRKGAEDSRLGIGFDKGSKGLRTTK